MSRSRRASRSPLYSTRSLSQVLYRSARLTAALASPPDPGDTHSTTRNNPQSNFNTPVTDRILTHWALRAVRCHPLRWRMGLLGSGGVSNGLRFCYRSILELDVRFISFVDFFFLFFSIFVSVVTDVIHYRSTPIYHFPLRPLPTFSLPTIKSSALRSPPYTPARPNLPNTSQKKVIRQRARWEAALYSPFLQTSRVRMKDLWNHALGTDDVLAGI